MSDFRADLHCHSTCSDGSLSPLEIVHLAKKKGLRGLSITDHDTTEAYVTGIVPLCKELGIELLTGVEFSAMHEDQSVHILGYGYQLHDPHIDALCAKHAARRKERNKAILELLGKHKMPISEEDLIAALPEDDAKSVRTIGRPHIALAMVKKGYVGSIQEAFKKYIGEDRSCYAHGTALSIQETIDAIHSAKGAAIIAHPHLLPNGKLLKILLEMPFDGIECYYGTFPAKDHKRWIKIAQHRQWLITGGSDFHGTIKPNIELGCSWIDEPTFNTLRDFVQS
jgi:predicted metal-dependent phosphoesterase TrpH